MLNFEQGCLKGKAMINNCNKFESEIFSSWHNFHRNLKENQLVDQLTCLFSTNVSSLVTISSALETSGSTNLYEITVILKIKP